MATVCGTDLYDNQPDGQPNVNFTHNWSSTNQYKCDDTKREIAPHRHSPKYPEYDSVPVRLRTFHQWPLQRPGPLQLTQAGLYYTGKKDQTVCYYCGGGLSSWNPEDNPDKEHERWYPNCELVKRRKQQNDNSSKKSGSVSKQDQTLEDPMKSVAVASLLEFGYTPEHIKMAVDRLMIQKGMQKQERTGKSVLRAVELMMILDNCDETDTDTDLSNAAKSKQFEEISEPKHCTDSSLSQSSTFPVPSSNQIKKEQVEDNAELDEKTLKEENQRLRDMSICKICMDNVSCIVFLPCGHMVCCASCSPAMRKCPICRVLVRTAVNAFMA